MKLLILSGLTLLLALSCGKKEEETKEDPAPTTTESSPDVPNAGTWVINNHETPTTPTALRSVSYDFTDETHKTLTVTLSQDGGSNWKSGGSVKYVLDGTSLSVTMDQDPEVTGDILIAWDTTTKAGSHTNISGEKVCWDADLNDADCP